MWRKFQLRRNLIMKGNSIKYPRHQWEAKVHSSWAPILHWFPTKGSRADQKWPSRPDKKFQFNLSMDLWAFLASYLSDTMEMELGQKLVCNFPFLVKLFRYISKFKKNGNIFFQSPPCYPLPLWRQAPTLSCFLEKSTRWKNFRICAKSHSFTISLDYQNKMITSN